MKRILLINDEPDLLQMCKMVLESEGYSVDVTTAASRAVQLARNADVVLLDLVMPRAAGENVFRWLREAPETGEIPVIIMSALDDAKERADGMGADGFVAKPFTPAALVDAVERALAASKERSLRPKSAGGGDRRAQ